MMTPTALEAIAKLTGEPCHPCHFKGTTYSVSKSWLVWYAKDDWHAVLRDSCCHSRHPSIQGVFDSAVLGVLWRDLDPQYVARLDMDRLKAHAKLCGYTMVDLAVRMGYVPTNKRVGKYLAGKLPVTQEFCQRAVAAFGRGVLRGE